MNFPKHISLKLSHNGHKEYYQDIAEYIDCQGLQDDFASLDDMACAIEMDNIWELSWCPDTPVGTCHVCASSLSRLMNIIETVRS